MNPATLSPTPTATATESGRLGDHNLLRLTWLASSALPVGAFSYSEGLEAGIEWAGVSDEASARAWLLDALWLMQARGDWVALAQAFTAWQTGATDEVDGLHTWVLSSRESAELRQQTEQMGRSLLDCIAPTLAADPAWTPRLAHARSLRASWPVALALALAHSGAPLRPALLTAAFGWCETQVLTAVKAVPLGQAAGQRLLAALVAEVPAAIDTALATPEPIQFTPGLAILSARHETQYSRLFRS